MPKVRDPRPMGKAACTQCGMVHNIRIDKHVIGDVLTPYVGGGNYGFCLRCKRTGTLRVTDIPKEPPKTPIGWRGVPK